MGPIELIMQHISPYVDGDVSWLWGVEYSSIKLCSSAFSSPNMSLMLRRFDHLHVTVVILDVHVG